MLSANSSYPVLKQKCLAVIAPLAFALSLCAAVPAAEPGAPAPLPPPPELVDEIDFGPALPYFEPAAAGETPEATQEALAPVTVVAAPQHRPEPTYQIVSSNQPSPVPAPQPSPQVQAGGPYRSQADYFISIGQYVPLEQTKVYQSGTTVGTVPAATYAPAPAATVTPAPVSVAPAASAPARPPVAASVPMASPAPVAAPAPAVASRRGARPLTISPPSRSMPDEYFNLPIDDEGIPGVVMPEIDGSYAEPGGSVAAVGRPRQLGLTIRQLAPWFSLAKGSEGEALDAKKRGDDAAYKDQLGKSIGAYMDIVNMADASTDAREEAWYGIARCEYRLANWWKAFEALERSFPEYYEKNEVAGRMKLEMYIGERMWRMGNETVADAKSIDGKPLTGYQAASRIYGAAVFNNPTDPDTALALLRRGDSAALDQNWKEASRYYRQVVEYFPESEQAMQARSSLTESIYRQEWPTGFPEAARTDVASLMDDVERADSRLSGEAEERRQRAVSLANNLEAETKLRHAKEYLKSFRVKKSRDAAVFLLGDVCSRYPNTTQAQEAADILRGMGIEPPVQLSDGKRFPLTVGWSGREDGPTQEDAGMSGGLVRLEGHNDNGGGVGSPSDGVEPNFEAE